MYSKVEFKKEVLRYPKLDTVLMIEETIEKAKSDKTAREIWQSLPRKVMWQTFMTTLDYLEHSGKILVANDKSIVWVWDPVGVKELLAKPHLRVR
jgi:hypothetical protein